MPRLHKAAHYARRALGTDGARRWCSATTWSRCCPTPTSSSTPRSSAPRARRPWPRGRRTGPSRRSACMPGRCCPRTCTSRGPRSRASRCGGCAWICCGWPVGGRRCCEEDPADEQAHLAHRRGQPTGATSAAALRQLERLDQALRRELGTTPSPEAEELRARCSRRCRGGRPPARRGRHGLVGRRDAGDQIRAPPGPGRRRAAAARCWSRATRGRQVRRARAWPRPWPGSAAGGSGVAPPRRSRAPGPTRRCWRRWPICAASTPPCWTASTTPSATRSTAPCPAGTWPGAARPAHQRLFLAAAELLRLAAAGHGLLLVVDDVHEADQASLRLLHYLARCAVADRVLLAAGPPARHRRPRTREVLQSLVARGVGARARAQPAGPGGHPPAAPHTVPRRWTTRRSSGSGRSAADCRSRCWSWAARPRRAAADGRLPRCRARPRGRSSGSPCSAPRSPPTSCSPWPGWPRSEAYRHLDTRPRRPGRRAGPTPGYRFRHALIRDALLRGDAAPGRRRRAAQVAERFAAPWARAPARVAHQLLAAGLPCRPSRTRCRPWRRPARWAPTATRSR